MNVSANGAIKNILKINWGVCKCLKQCLAYGRCFIHIIMVMMGFPGGSDGRQSTFHAGNVGSVPRLGRSPGEGSSYPPQYPCLENPMDRGAWRDSAHGVAKNGTRLTLSLPLTSW